jgi:glycosyltransferase involved in cell wall biosynthesis
MKWAYGFDIFDLLRSKDKEAMAWKKVMLRKMEEAGIENLGKISHKEVAKLTKSAGVMLYPTHFMEIDCVSARKAQLGGAHVVCSDFGALKTTVKYGYKISTPYTKDNWCPPYALDMADDPERDDEYVEAVLKAFENNEREEMQAWAKSFTPDYVAKKWEKVWLV